MKNQLPINAHRDSILSALDKRQNSRLVLNAPTGSGKSTGVPPILFENGFADKGRIVIVQPRRIAARLLASRVADTLGVTLGKEVGYSVRFDSRYTDETKILFITDGILMRWIAQRPLLSEVSTIIFDEFHERRIDSDIALGHCKHLQDSQKRTDLNLIVMSATLAMEKVQAYLSPCESINAEGRSFPVDIHYRGAKPQVNPRTRRVEPPLIWEQIKTLSKEIVSLDDSGDWLVFLPGAHEIRKTVDTLESSSWLSHFTIYPLYSALPPAQQQEALNAPSPKIIVSTNVAETSITIPTIKTVIDSGLARESEYDPRRDMDSLLVRKISQASAEQRAGRAGRVSEGTCFRLWSQPDHEKRLAFQLPEIKRTDLAPSILVLHSLGWKDVEAFPWVEAPEKASVQKANSLLTLLGAIDENGLTENGSWLNEFPLSPRLARLILAGIENNCLAESLFAAAYLQGEALVQRNSGIQQQNHGRRPNQRSQNKIADFEERHDLTSFHGLWRVYAFAESNNFQLNALKSFGISARATRELSKTFQQLQHIIKKMGINLSPVNFDRNESNLRDAIAATFPDRLTARLGEGTLSSRMIGERKGKLEDSTVARQGQLFFATQIREIEGRDVLTHLSGLARITREELEEVFPNNLKKSHSVEFDEITKKVVKVEKASFSYSDSKDQSVLELEKNILSTKPDATESAELLAQMIHEKKASLPLWDSNVEQWISRVNQLAEWMPELELPPIDKEGRLILLQQICEGSISQKELKKLDPWKALNDWLSPLQKKSLNAYTPTEITLTNGTKTKIFYEIGSDPLIKVKLQGLYDVKESPSICLGKVTLKIEILAPNQRPWQVTQDLSSFWENGYMQMKKDLAGRYPKHEWR